MSEAFAIRRAYADVAGCQLHYRHAGDRASPALLLLHQSPSSSAMYLPLMAQLADQFYLVAPDTPGFGSSDPVVPDGAHGPGIEDYARVIHEFISALGMTPCGVFGHHTGAAIAVQLEHDFPGTTKAMALSGPTLLNASQQQALPELAAPFALAENGDHLLGMWHRIRAKDPAAPLALAQRELLSAFVCGDSYQQSYLAVTRQDFARQLDTINCPVLVYAGDKDPLYGALAPTLERLSHGTSAALPGGERTYVCERQVELVAVLLGDFFMEHMLTPEGLN